MWISRSGWRWEGRGVVMLAVVVVVVVEVVAFRWFVSISHLIGLDCAEQSWPV